ncbi:hypothetical protein D3C80_1993310 [compost metagenome]
MQIDVFEHQRRQLTEQGMDKAADLRVAAAHGQENLVARQLSLGVHPQGVLAPCQADAFGLGQAVDTVDGLGGLGLGR